MMAQVAAEELGLDVDRAPLGPNARGGRPRLRGSPPTETLRSREHRTKVSASRRSARFTDKKNA